MQGILFKKNIKSTSPLFLADLLEWRLVRVAATGIRNLAFRFTRSIDQIAIAGATPGLLLSFAVRGNVGLAMAFDWGAARGGWPVSECVRRGPLEKPRERSTGCVKSDWVKQQWGGVDRSTEGTAAIMNGSDEC
jgi:hypothetical protein